MRKTYLIHAWCVRPFITYLDEVEAKTPEQAIAIARRQPAKLLDNAEECNAAYPWDEFAAYDASGAEVLRVLDTEACQRQAAPIMHETLVYLAQVLADFKPDFLRQLGLAVALTQVEQALAVADKTTTQTPPAAAEDDPY